VGGVIRRRVLVRGLVQGVGFRYAAAQAARTRGVAGWVRNCPDGRVEAAFEGERGAVDAMVAWCGRGPRGADVVGIDVLDEPPEGLGGFDIVG
jgi:acylphosphatase